MTTTRRPCKVEDDWLRFLLFGTRTRYEWRGPLSPLIFPVYLFYVDESGNESDPAGKFSYSPAPLVSSG